MTNVTVPPEIASQVWALAWATIAPLIGKYGGGAFLAFLAVAWMKEWLPLHGTSKKVVLPLLSLFVGIVIRWATIAAEVAAGGSAPSNGWTVSLEIVRGLGIGITASLFQKWIGWRLEQWMKSKLKKS